MRSIDGDGSDQIVAKMFVSVILLCYATRHTEVKAGLLIFREKSALWVSNHEQRWLWTVVCDVGK